MESDISAEEPEKCAVCENGDDIMTHLEENFSCLEAQARKVLPRRLWDIKYINDTPLLLFDMSICLRLCLNTGSCPLPKHNNISIRQFGAHLNQSWMCFQFYRSHPAVLEHLTKRIPENVRQLTEAMSSRKGYLVKEKLEEDRTGISGFEARIAREMCDKCGQCGMLGPVGERLKLTKTDVSGVLACKDCVDGDRAFHVQPKNLANRRAALYRTNRGTSDHLVAVRAEHHTGHVLFPANVANQQVWVTEGRMDEEHFTVVVPTAVTAIKRLNEAARRASEEWTNGLKTVSLATESPRTILVTDFPMFLQAVSVLYRAKLAQFNRSVVHMAEQRRNAATAEIVERSPQKKIRASYLGVNYDVCVPSAMKDTFCWSDGAVSERMAKSEARRAWNGRVKTSVEVRILADEPVHWSPILKVIIAKTFERDVTESVEGVQTLTCAGGCTPTSCNNVHPHLDQFLEENMVGLARQARIPVVLNFLKIAVASFEKSILKPNCRQWDFNLKFDKKGWNVLLVGSVWTNKKASLNDKIATKRRIRTDLDIVKLILARPEDLETVSMDQGHLQTR